MDDLVEVRSASDLLEIGIDLTGLCRRTRQKRARALVEAGVIVVVQTPDGPRRYGRRSAA